MYIRSSFVFFSLLALLVSDVLAAALYRGDRRSPATIKSGGGFKSKGESGTTLLQHASKQGGDQKNDKFISTSTEKSVAQKFAGSNGYVYTLESSKISSPIHNLATELGHLEPHPSEKEQSVEHLIPYSAITQIEKASGEIVPLRRRNGEFVVRAADQEEQESAQDDTEADQEEPEDDEEPAERI